VQLQNYPAYETKFDGYDAARAGEGVFHNHILDDWLRNDLSLARNAGKKIIVTCTIVGARLTMEFRTTSAKSILLRWSTFLNMMKEFSGFCCFFFPAIFTRTAVSRTAT